MATTTYGVNDALAVKLWAKTLAVEVLKATKIRPLIGPKPSNIIHYKTETKKSAGDKITFGLAMQLSGDGVTEGESAEGNEEALTTYDDALYINELLHQVRVKKGIDAQRVPFVARDYAKDLLRDWWAKRYSVSFFNQVCGNTRQTNTKFTGLNAVAAPSSDNVLYAGSTKTDEGQTSSDIFTLDLIDKAKEKATMASPPLRPTMVNGEELYVIYLHPYQITDMRTNTSTGQWQDIQKAVMQGGKYGDSSNPIFSGSYGVYNGVVIRDAIDIPTGTNSTTGAEVTTTRRAVVLGAQAAAFANGRNGRKASYKWVEESFDYGRQVGISAQAIFGMKKCQFNSKDFGTIVVSTYAAAHN